MFRIRRVYDDVLPVDKQAIREVKDILRAQFSAIREQEITGLEEKLRNPMKHRFRPVLNVAEKGGGAVLGFSLALHDPANQFVYLDWIASAKGLSSRGMGGALYERLREDALALGAKGLFFECLPDDPEVCPSPEALRQNRARLRFYEAYGARPIVGTAYETPVKADDRYMPHLVYDPLAPGRALRREFARRVVRSILENKYAHLCPPEYVESVVRSFRDDPVGLREFRYVKAFRAPPIVFGANRERVLTVMSDAHQIHHVRERGYVESPVRISRIFAELRQADAVDSLPPREAPMKPIREVHAPDYVEYLRKACAQAPEGKSVYPYVFPIRNVARPPEELAIRAGYYCIDTFTPIHRNAFLAAKRGVDCALTAAEAVLRGRRFAYALVRPPGHHAERRSFGGFCYFNNNAIAAHVLSAHGKAAILDIDYHHGNGQQQIFYDRSDVLTVSIHGHPHFAYPYFTGFEDERGDGFGQGYNVNIPLPEQVDGPRYRKALEGALQRIGRFKPTFLVVALGLDTAKGDPTGTWTLAPKDLAENGRMIASLRLPTLVVQEGGYRTRTLGQNAAAFFQGLLEGARRV
ncbi:MAG: histone deacetylase family protein [Candidatus Methylomirabilis sp.]|nr:histone deacetylase family protein [Deltaproteobacteria bacterium]